jgi:hypothetical protein
VKRELLTFCFQSCESCSCSSGRCSSAQLQCRQAEVIQTRERIILCIVPPSTILIVNEETTLESVDGPRVHTTLVMQPTGEVISLKAWRHRFWRRDALLGGEDKKDALWSDL